LYGLRPQPHASHMSIPEAAATAQQLRAPQTYLTHLTHLSDHATQVSVPRPGASMRSAAVK